MAIVVAKSLYFLVQMRMRHEGKLQNKIIHASVWTSFSLADPLMHHIFFGLESAIGPKIRIIPKRNQES